jgi:hypothetical protein
MLSRNKNIKMQRYNLELIYLFMLTIVIYLDYNLIIIIHASVLWI